MRRSGDEGRRNRPITGVNKSDAGVINLSFGTSPAGTEDGYELEVALEVDEPRSAAAA